jgi:hypothetical protein
MFGGSRSFRFEVAAALVDAQGRTMGTDTVYLTSSAMGFNAGDKRLNPPPASIAQPVFRRAGIKDYTPPLTVRITSVNGISVESPNENGFMRVLTKAEHSAAISAK